MISTQTVIVLGAGSSVPYNFPSGAQLLDEIRGHRLDTLKNILSGTPLHIVRSLHEAMRGTLERSMDAALETLAQPIVLAGKIYMARRLLECERAMRDGLDLFPARWHEFLWEACNLSSLEGFRSTPITLVTYNYDRTVEHALLNSLKVRFPDKPLSDYLSALRNLVPIHLHGQLGRMLVGSGNPEYVTFGGGNDDRETDIWRAANSIRIVHEPDPTDQPFVDARNAIKTAQRIIFLGFSYAQNNMARLQLEDHLDKDAEIYLCVCGFTKPEVETLVKPHFTCKWDLRYDNIGDVSEDIVRFFRQRPSALR